MSDDAEDLRRARFYGVQDLATGWHVARVAELTERFDPRDVSMSTMDVLEHYNVQQYLEHGLLPNTYTGEERERAKARVPQIRSAVARYFTSIDSADFAAKITGVDHAYHGDLLKLLGRNKAFERCDAGTALPALEAAGVHLGELLASRELVRAYDREMRDLLLASPRAAEHLVKKYLQDDPGADVHIPRSFAPTDARELLEKYIDSDDANPNYVGLIANAREIRDLGIDARLKLRAKRRRDEIVAELFHENDGLKTGCEVSISDAQQNPVVSEIDTSEGLVARYTYSRGWLEQTCGDNPGILDNFLFLFEFVDREALLVLPSYPSQLGVLERVMGTTGSTEYKIGAVFRAIDVRSLLQVHLYRGFLESKGLDLERVISWFFQEYLVEEFGAANFTFAPSGAGAYLQRVRHLFAEMESVANQYALFARDGELDRDLLTMGSEQVRYKEIPSLLPGKYVCPDGEEVAAVLHLLFSDQSSLKYISKDLSADNAADLLANNKIRYDDFHDYQKPAVDHLIHLGIVEDTGSHVRLARAEQFRILEALFATEAANYYHLSDAGRGEADAMVARGWATRRSSLLTDAEGRYFNYFLNGTDFSNGPALRNKYLHGAQANAYGEDAHFCAYLSALRLTVALVIKINDDLALAAAERSRGQDDP